MNITPHELEELLVPPGHVSKTHFETAVLEMKQNGTSLEDALIALSLISDDNLGRVIAEYYDLHFKSLHGVRIEDSYLEFFPEVVARSQQAIVFEVTEDVLKIATCKVKNYPFFKLLEKKANRRVDVFYTTKQNLKEGLRFYKGDLHDQIKELIAACRSGDERGSVVSLVDLILEYAHDSRASDIHIEPHDECVLVRFRIDGILHEASRYHVDLHEKIVFRIKILSHLQTDEHAAAQDGRFDYGSDGNVFDIRVSIVPTTGGENVVMRLLSSGVRQYTLETLGLRDVDYQKVIRATQKPHGMILSVGPTGSGKTTVLYTILERLNRPEVNIMTIEDPVEYDITGVQQTQVNPRKNLTFSTGLRSLVRQDPDIVMVGEIRDEETADIAINAAMTGHLLLSTLHTNDAATTFPRLIEMGIEPFLVASSVNLIVALRLVRIICEHCKESYFPTEHDLRLLEVNPKLTAYLKEISKKDDLSQIRMYKGSGCKICGHSGYSGRTGIYEIIEMSEALRVFITQKASAAVINEEAQRLGMTSLLYDGIYKVINGTTTLEEVLKAARG